MPDYSIVVPVYNSCESLEEIFLRIGQTMKKIEKSGCSWVKFAVLSIFFLPEVFSD